MARAWVQKRVERVRRNLIATRELERLYALEDTTRSDPGRLTVERTQPVQAGISGEANKKGEPNGKAQIRLTGLA